MKNLFLRKTAVIFLCVALTVFEMLIFSGCGKGLGNAQTNSSDTTKSPTQESTADHGFVYEEATSGDDLQSTSKEDTAAPDTAPSINWKDIAPEDIEGYKYVFRDIAATDIFLADEALRISNAAVVTWGKPTGRAITRTYTPSLTLRFDELLALSGKLPKDISCEYAKIAVRIDHVFKETAESSFSSIYEADKIRAVLVPTQYLDKIEENKQALVFLSCSDDMRFVYQDRIDICPYIELDWNEENDHTFAPIFPFKDGELQVSGDCYKQKDGAYMLDIIYYLESANNYMKNRFPEMPIFENGMTPHELQLYFSLACNMYVHITSE